jgi:hypothetical protein
LKYLDIVTCIRAAREHVLEFFLRGLLLVVHWLYWWHYLKSGVFIANGGEPSVGVNILDQTFRIQAWDFTDCQPPNLANC